jgi:hypothetical protein
MVDIRAVSDRIHPWFFRRVVHLLEGLLPSVDGGGDHLATSEIQNRLRPRTPLRALKICVCSIRRWAKVVLSGGRASARSL